MAARTYIAIDLKSFYASVECVDRQLDPLKARLVVADESRTDKTICLAVSPALKAIGIGGRARLWEVRQRTSDFIIAPPRMKRYMQVSSEVVGVYLKYVSAEDMHVYSVDEVFIDATDYLRLYGCDAHTLAMRMIKDVLRTTGITATAGIGENLYLAKVAMDIVAKHCEADADGVRIAQLSESSYRRQLWDHRPLTDFWRVGRGTVATLEKAGIRTMGDIAVRSLDPSWEEFFYKHFGVGAELLVDHAWGWEPCTIADIKAYRPKDSSLSRSQVLSEPYSNVSALIIAKEIAQGIVLEMVRTGMTTDQITLDVNYDAENLEKGYKGPLKKDFYGRMVPKPSHGSANLPAGYTCSEREILSALTALWEAVSDKSLTVRRVTVSACHLTREADAPAPEPGLFDNPASDDSAAAKSPDDAARDLRMQDAILRIKDRFGKNAILRGINFEDGSTAIERNGQVGGHKG